MEFQAFLGDDKGCFDLDLSALFQDRVKGTFT